MCGSSEIVPLTLGSVVEISEGVTVMVRVVGMCSTDFNEWFYTPEGDRIPRDTKPTYWRHSTLDDNPDELRKLIERLTKKSSERNESIEQ